MILEMILSEFTVLMNDDPLESSEEIWLGVGVGSIAPSTDRLAQQEKGRWWG